MKAAVSATKTTHSTSAMLKEINSYVLILRLPRMATMPVTLTQNEVMSQTGDYTSYIRKLDPIALKRYDDNVKETPKTLCGTRLQ